MTPKLIGVTETFAVEFGETLPRALQVEGALMTKHPENFDEDYCFTRGKYSVARQINRNGATNFNVAQKTGRVTYRINSKADNPADKDRIHTRVRQILEGLMAKHGDKIGA